MCSGGIVLYPATIRCVQSRTSALKRKCACDYHVQREYRDILYLLFFSVYIIIIYRLLRRHATIADYLTTIRRLFRDRPATIPGTAGEPRGNLCTVPERARRSSGREVWRQERRRAAGGTGSEGSRQPREHAGHGREHGGNIKVTWGIPLFARELPFKRAFTLYGYTDIPTI